MVSALPLFGYMILTPEQVHHQQNMIFSHSEVYIAKSLFL